MSKSDDNARPEFLDLSYDMFLSSIDGEESESTRFNRWIEEVEKEGLYAFETIRMQAQYPEVNVKRTDGTAFKLLNFSGERIKYFHPFLVLPISLLPCFAFTACGTNCSAAACCACCSAIQAYSIASFILGLRIPLVFLALLFTLLAPLLPPSLLASNLSTSPSNLSKLDVRKAVFS